MQILPFYIKKTSSISANKQNVNKLHFQRTNDMATRKTTRKRSTRKRSTKKRSTRKSSRTTKDLEAKIAQLEGKLSQFSAQAGHKPAEAKPTPPPPPPPKPAEVKAAPPPPPPPKPAPQAKAPPRTLESVIESVPMGNWIMQKQRHLLTFVKTQELGQDDIQMLDQFQPQAGLYKNQRLQDTLHLQTNTLQTNKD